MPEDFGSNAVFSGGSGWSDRLCWLGMDRRTGSSGRLTFGCSAGPFGQTGLIAVHTHQATDGDGIWTVRRSENS